MLDEKYIVKGNLACKMKLLPQQYGLTSTSLPQFVNLYILLNNFIMVTLDEKI